MTWENILKKPSNLTSFHFRHLRNAVHAAFEAHGDAFLKDPKAYKDEITLQAAINYNQEMGLEGTHRLSTTKRKYNSKFPHVINRIINNMRKEKNDDVEKLSIFPKKKKKPKPINRKKDKPKSRGPFTDRD